MIISIWGWLKVKFVFFLFFLGGGGVGKGGRKLFLVCLDLGPVYMKAGVYPT